MIRVIFLLLWCQIIWCMQNHIPSFEVSHFACSSEENNPTKLKVVGITTLSQEPFLYGNFFVSKQYKFINVTFMDFKFSKMAILASFNGSDYAVFIDKNEDVYIISLHDDEPKIMESYKFKSVIKLAAKPNCLVLLSRTGHISILFVKDTSNPLAFENPQDLDVSASDLWVRENTLYYQKDQTFTLIDLKTLNKLKSKTFNMLLSHLDVGYSKNNNSIHFLMKNLDYIKSYCKDGTFARDANIYCNLKIKTLYCVKKTITQKNTLMSLTGSFHVSQLLHDSIICIIDVNNFAYFYGNCFEEIGSNVKEVLAIHQVDNKIFYLFLTTNGTLALKVGDEVKDILNVRGTITKDNYNLLPSNLKTKSLLFLLIMKRYWGEYKILVPKNIIFKILSIVE